MPPVVALLDDILFGSRIREAARAAGRELLLARSTDELLEAARSGATLVLVDADCDRVPWGEALAALRADPATACLPVVAFFSHVRAERAKQARAAGADRALARSAFVAELPRLVGTSHATPEEKTC
jgi:CheY-like chemotaxis protein